MRRLLSLVALLVVLVACHEKPQPAETQPLRNYEETLRK